jgi:CheY-like chemotaxis protein
MKILIVDDSATIRMFLKSILEPRNFQVTEAVSAEEAISLFEKNSYDLITLDIEMTGSNGYAACKKIREIEKSRNSKTITPILFITSNDTMQGRIKGFEAGTTDFITKPFTKEFLLETVQNILYPKNLLEGINVLLVEDSLPIRDIIKRIISEQGCSVIEADNGKIALDIIERDPSKIDLVLTDYYMPVMNGNKGAKVK